MGRVSLVEALELTALIARKDPRRRGRAGARWLRRYLETNEDAGIDELALAAGALAALGGAAHEAAYGALLELAERARRHSDA
jgi:hypothetical protein